MANRFVEAARKTLESLLPNATAAGKRNIRKLLDNSNALLDLPEDALVRLANGDVPDSVKAMMAAGTGGGLVTAGAQFGRPDAVPESRTEGAPETEVKIEPQAQAPKKQRRAESPPQEDREPITYDRFGNPVYYEDPTPEPEGGWSPRPAGAGFSGYAADYDQQLGPRQHATFKILVDAGISPERAAGIVRGQISLTQQERDAVVANTGSQQANAAGGLEARRQGRMTPASQAPASPQSPAASTAPQQSSAQYGQESALQHLINAGIDPERAARLLSGEEPYTEEDARLELAYERQQKNARMGPIDLGDMNSERQGVDETDAEYSQRMYSTNSKRRELARIRGGGLPPSFDPGTLPDPQSLMPSGVTIPGRGMAPRVSPSSDNNFYSYAIEGRDFQDGGAGSLARPAMKNTAGFRDFVMEDGPMSRRHRRHDPEGSSAYYDQQVAPKIRANAQKRMQELQAKRESEQNQQLGEGEWGGQAETLYDAKQERAKLERRAMNFARQNKISYQQALATLSQGEGSPFTALQKTLPGDSLTTIERLSGKERIRRADREREAREKEARLALSSTRGMNRTQAARYLEAKRILNDPASPIELRRAAGYFLAPQMAQVDAEAAKNGGGDAGDAAIQQQILNAQREEREMKGRKYARENVNEPDERGLLYSSPVATQEEWNRLKRKALGDFAKGSPEYNGALEWFHERYGTEFVPPPEAGPNDWGGGMGGAP